MSSSFTALKSGSPFSRAWQVLRLVILAMWRKVRFAIRARFVGAARQQELSTQYHVKNAEEMVETLGQMKGVFMKIGQILSFADESMPAEARAIMAGLQNDAPPMAFSLVEEVIVDAYEGPLDSVFASFEQEPIASASIGQVHRATLLDGTEVAVKVQYPGVAEAIGNDLKATDGLAAMIGTFNKNIDAPAVVAELQERMADELDYRIEAANQQLFYTVWAGHPLVRIPQVFGDLCREKVLVQTFVQGLSFDDYLAMSDPEMRNLSAHVLSDFVWDSMFRFHMFNGDPHPGNYLFHADGGITFLDFGCVKFFQPTMLHNIIALFGALTTEDRDAFRRACFAIEIVQEGRPYDGEFLWEFFNYQAGPYILDREFTFDADYLRAAKSVMDPVKLQRINLPADLLFFNRITFGLNALFAQLGATDNFHAIYQRYLHPEANHAPALARLGVDLPDQFLTAQVVPVSRA